MNAVRKPKTIDEFLGVPALAIDLKIARISRGPKAEVSLRPDQKLERRIAWKLIERLAAKGFRPTSLFDGEEMIQLKGTQRARAVQAMELIFNLDEASLRFTKRGPGHGEHGVLLVLGNGSDIISDWNYNSDDADGFNAAMEEITKDWPYEELT